MSIERPEHRTISNVSPEALPAHIERVDEAFDNTSLPQAHAEGLVDNQVPDHAQDVIDIANPDTANFIERTARDEPVSHRRRNLLIGLGAGAAGVALAVGAFVGIKGATDGSHNAVPGSDPKLTGQLNETSPSPSALQEHTYTVQELLIPATLSGQDAAKMLFEQRFSAWYAAGASDKLNSDWHKSAANGADALKPITASTAKTFADALFVSDWQNRLSLVRLEQREEAVNSNALETWLMTYKSHDGQDKEPYKRSLTVEKVDIVSSSDASTILTVYMTEHENADKNRAIQIDPNHTSIEGNKLVWQVQLDKVDGSWKLADLK
ncbi:hypothetical protein [Arthrobacter sp. 2MCAF14]|uniref:hypothetical protein n=1 Tax=Arthrobacter sp. 2MCAF14 TaxID=3232982 RepID=UPI003F91A234